MRLALYSATKIPSLLGARALQVRRVGQRFSQKLSTSIYTQSTAVNYHIGSSVSTMSDQCDIKKSEDTSLEQNAEVDCGKPKEELPKLTPAEFRVYNRLAEHMDYFHNHFRHSWNELYTACCENKRPSGVSIRQFLNMGTQFLSQLNIHHSIEEQSIFPILAKKMPEFKREVHLLKQHKEIHKGMDRLDAYLMDCRSGEKELRLDEMKKVMDSFGKVLWDHLEDEVRTLGAENMRKYWTQEEMRRLPI